MEYKEIKEIMKDMENSKLAELEIEFPDGTKVKVKNVTNEKIQSIEPRLIRETPVENLPIKKVDDSKLVTSPMVGTFYAKSSPSAEPYVEVGKHVKKGDVLCIIEAMKLMNEIEAEEDGEIAEILVKDGEIVDYGKPLFRMK